MILELSRCTLRPWREGDAPALARHANDPRVAENLRDRFPHPYTPADARAWIAAATAQPPPPRSLAIEVGGEAAGGIGIELGSDVESVIGELGIWLGAACQGRGIGTEAVRAFAAHAARTFGLTCIAAHTFGRNGAAQRMLDKAGFRRIGVLPRSVRKGGQVLDRVLFAWNPGDPEPGRCRPPS